MSTSSPRRATARVGLPSGRVARCVVPGLSSFHRRRADRRGRGSKGGVYLLDAEGIRAVAYTETDHYLITRGFLSNPQRTLEVLLGEDEA